ncbi:MAG: hypothetical protein COA58_14580 [Bacteroidetes bacterium]|nr:MAG: hypothetical protein COA58_14580 [Bacteroidota bacterium]
MAEAYGEKLYDVDLKKLITDDASFEDSVFITREYINVWISKQVLLNEANRVLSDSEKDKSSQLEQYKIDLLTYEVLNKLALEQMDTAFTPLELEDYYDSHKDEFELSQNILKINFFKISKDADDIDLFWSNFKAGDESIYSTLKGYAEQGGNYYLDNTNWVSFDDILKEIPIVTYGQEHYLNNNKYIKLNDGSFVYFIKIIDFKIRSSTSPFSIERDNIKEILLMKRQQKLVKSIETKLLDKAYRDKQIKTF